MFTILAFINFFKNYNTYETRSWGFDRFDFEAIKKIQSGAVKGHITIGAFRLFTPVLQYYANTYFQNKLITVSNILEFHSTDTVCDYYYIEKSDASRMLQSYKTDTIFGNEYSLIMKKIN